MKRALYAVIAVVVVLSAVVVGVKVKQRLSERNAEVAKEAEIERQVDMLKKQNPAAFKGQGGKAAEEQARKAIGESVAVSKLIIEEAETRGIKVEKTEIDAAVNQVKFNYPSEKIFFRDLQRQGMTEEDYRKNMYNQLITSKFMGVVSKEGVKVTDAEARAYYEANIGQFTDQHDPNKKKSYEQVADIIKARLLQQKEQENWQKVLDELTKKARSNSR